MGWTDIENQENSTIVMNKVNFLGRTMQALIDLGTQRKVVFEDEDTLAELLPKLDATFIPTESYVMFCADINDNSLDAAFGKNNENRIMGIGKQLAMYAWHKGTTIYETFDELIVKQTLADIVADITTKNICLNNPYIRALIEDSPYAKSVFNI